MAMECSEIVLGGHFSILYLCSALGCNDLEIHIQFLSHFVLRAKITESWMSIQTIHHPFILYYLFLLLLLWGHSQLYLRLIPGSEIIPDRI